MELPSYIIETLTRLEGAGFEAYVVGGCVRDSLRGFQPHDWDIATSATPSHVHAVFTNEKLYDIGIQHGTIAIGYPEGLVEVTTFRQDGSYLDTRHPDRVEFLGSIEEDLARRDFTMNAIAYNPSKSYVDPFDGLSAIRNRQITCVGTPDERLAEDALRIMRALRFSATLDFAIDDRLAQSLHRNRELLEKIAPERISSELLKMLVGDRILPVLLEYPDVLAVFIPEIEPTLGHDQNSPYHCYDIWEHTAHAVAESKPDAMTRLALLLHDLGKPETYFTDETGRGHFYGHDKLGEEIARKRLQALHFDNKTIELIASSIRYHQAAFKPETMHKWIMRLGEPLVRLLIEIKRGDLAAHAGTVVDKNANKMDVCEAKVDELIAKEACFSLRDLAIDGDDLLGLGVPEGPEIGRILTALLDLVVDGESENDREALLKEAGELWSQRGDSNP